MWRTRGSGWGRRAATAIAMVGGLAACGGGSNAAVLEPRADTPAPEHVVTEPLYLDSVTVFAPPPAGTHPKLTPREAFDAFAGDTRPIPDDVDYELGLLTVPPSVTDVLTYGYHLTSPAGCVHSQPVRLTPQPAPSDPPQCIGWDFIDADTGRYVQGMSQQVGGPDHAPSPTPPPGTDELAHGGALPPNMERFSPDALVVQAPLSTIRWTFDMAHCDIELHWFLPPDGAASDPAPRPCRIAGVFSVDATAGLTSRGHVFSVVAGHIAGALDSPRSLVRVVLASGKTMSFDPDEDNRAWVFPIQRCGDFAGTLPVAVEEVRYDGGTVIDRLAVPSATFDRQSPADCDVGAADAG